MCALFEKFLIFHACDKKQKSKAFCQRQVAYALAADSNFKTNANQPNYSLKLLSKT